jgi:hypothetical protein
VGKLRFTLPPQNWYTDLVMPRVTRKQTTVQNRPAYVWWTGLFGVVFAGFGAAYALGVSDQGMIHVGEKLSHIDQTNVATPVLTDTTASQPNGGLRPASLDDGGPLAPEPPTPISAEPDATTSASTTPDEGGQN